MQFSSNHEHREGGFILPELLVSLVLLGFVSILAVQLFQMSAALRKKSLQLDSDLNLFIAGGAVTREGRNFVSLPKSEFMKKYTSIGYKSTLCRIEPPLAVFCFRKVSQIDDIYMRQDVFPGLDAGMPH